MRDVSNKINTLRTATARAVLRLSPETVIMIRENRVPKGDPFAVAKVAAIQGAKNTPQIIPYCHPVPLDFVSVDFEMLDDEIRVTTTARAIYKTGVEMEALTAASVAALNLYDMLKMLDDVLRIESIELVEKEGGKSDFRQPFAKSLKAAVLVISDSVASGKKEDRSGKIIVERLEAEGLAVADYRTVPDDIPEIRKTICDFADAMKVDLVITTGGTGVTPRDNTPEAIGDLFERELPGVAEAIRAYGQDRTPYAMLSRSLAGTRGKTLILCLPGSTGGVRDALDALFPSVLHAYKMLWGGGHPARETVAATREHGG
ncbi:MAG TPA: bifunctional molybdenum cofactor biosynthesis protein MoaC/MoaB [Coleofasciculaceae cyanobacterium]|jgi:molybdenum cofactor biosynthesis protein MoaC